MTTKKQFKPMLGKSADAVNYPCYASFKRDGIRGITMKVYGLGRILTRSLKNIENVQLQHKFQYLKDYCMDNICMLDGEFYHHDLNFQVIQSLVMTNDFLDPKTIKKLSTPYEKLSKSMKSKTDEKTYEENRKTILGFYKCRPTQGGGVDYYKFNNPLEFHCFDIVIDENFDNPFKIRNQNIQKINVNQNIGFVKVEQVFIQNEKDLKAFFDNAIENGYEGAIIRSPDSPYKFGRSTVKEGYMLKMKPYETFDAKIFSVEERFENTNESFKNELGQSTKRNTVDAKKGTGMAATFTVEYKHIHEVQDFSIPEIHRFGVNITGDEDFRREIWENKEKYIGRWIEYKAMMIGAKNVPRPPMIFLRFREDRDEQPPLKNNIVDKKQTLITYVKHKRFLVIKNCRESIGHKYKDLQKSFNTIGECEKYIEENGYEGDNFEISDTKSEDRDK